MVEQEMVKAVHTKLDELLKERLELAEQLAQMSELAAAATDWADRQAQMIESQASMISRLRDFEIQAKDYLQDLADRATDDVVCFQQIDQERVEYLLSFKLNKGKA